MLLFGAIAALLGLQQPRKYASKAVLFVSSASGGGLIEGLGPMKSAKDDLYLMESLRSVGSLRGVVDNLNLKNRAEFWSPSAKIRDIDQAMLEMKGRVSFVNNQGVITIRALTINPQLSSDLVNEYVKQASLHAHKRKKSSLKLLQEKIDQTREKIRTLEKSILAKMDASGVASPEANRQIQTEYEAFAQLRQAIETKTAESQGLAAALDSAGTLEDQLKLQSNQAMIRGELSALTQTAQNQKISLSRMPGSAVEISKDQREIMLQNVVLGSLYQQMSTLTILENERQEPFEIIELAYPARMPEGRHIAINSVLAAISGFLVTVALTHAVRPQEKPTSGS